MAFGLVLSNVNFNPINVKGTETIYSLTLDSTNKVTSAGDVTQKTKLGNDVKFTYANIQSTTSGHVTLNSDGTLVNKDHIRSIQSITATFDVENSLKFKVSYGGDKWNAETVMTSGYTYSLDTNPYFVQFSTTSAVTISEITITYSCVVNPSAHENEQPTDSLLGVIDFWNSSSASDTQTATLVNKAYVTARSYDSDDTSTRKAKTLVSDVSASYTYQNRYGGIGLSSGGSGASFVLTLAEGIEPTSVTVITGTRSPSKTLTLNDVGKSVTKNCTDITALNDTYTNSLTWEFNSAPDELWFVTNKEAKLAIYRIYLYGLAGPTYDEPAESIIGFEASDGRNGQYYTTDIFDEDNELHVWANLTGGGTQDLAKGENGYSYSIKKLNTTPAKVVDTSEEFPGEGSYQLTITYKDFIPVVIHLNVEFKVSPSEIFVTSANTSFNTAQKLSDYTNGITADIYYNNETSVLNVAYSEFSEKGVSLSLANPSGVATPITNLFGVAGTWTIKVASVDNDAIYGTVEIEVAAIPVTEITVSGSSTSVEAESKIQLTVSVTPNNATNQTVEWSSNDITIATVNTTGEVTGVSAGTARITATATDGSQVYGYCDVTVTAKPNTISDTLTRSTTGIPDQTGGSVTYSSWSNKKLTSDAVYAGQSAGENNAIQLRSRNSDSGIITTTSGGKISKVTVEWNSNTTSGRTLNVYGKKTAYSSPTDLYGSNAGTLIGTIVCGTSTELAISGDYTYVGVRSNASAMYLDSITFVWGEEAAPTPVYPTSISLSGTSSIHIGGTTQLSVDYQPSGVNVKNVTFSSDKTNIATVTETGLVTGLAQGTATITATAETANSGSTSATIDITVNTIAVTGVTLNKSNTSIKAGNTETLTATVSPTNATNKSVNWVSTDTAVATVSNGVVTGVASGTTTIRVVTVDGNKTAECSVSVTASSGEESFTISYNDFVAGGYAKNDGTHSTTGSNSTTLSYYTSNVCLQDGAMQFKSTPGYLYSKTSLTLNSLTINDVTSGTFSVYGGDSENPSTEISGSNNTFSLSDCSYFKVSCSGTSKCSSITITTGTPTPVDPTSIAVSPSSLQLAVNGSQALSVNYTPSNANQNKEVTWISSNTNVATVSNDGTVNVKSTASVGQTATITARLTNLTSISATCVVTVIEQQIDDQTILIYMCGSDLESDGQTNSSKAAGYASADLKEILGVTGKPNDVNIVIETGGAKCWKSYGISAGVLTRYHVSDGSLSKDKEITKAGMGETSTLQSFLTWGMQTYPAQRTSLILWNHGGAMRGVCYDENYSSNPLLNSEVNAAVKNTFTTLGRSTSDKLEWIGYDACLMSVQDIAEFNSQYFNYMVASEESEAGFGWEYDTWVDDAYAKESTETILTSIVDGFIDSTNKLYQKNNWGASDQTLSWLDLSAMSAYKTAWETMSTTLNPLISSYGKSNFQKLMRTIKSYGDTVYTDSDLEEIAADNNVSVSDVISSYALEQSGSYYYDYGWYYYGIFDAKDFLNKIKSTSAFSSASTQVNNTLSAFNNLVKYSLKGSGAGNSNGLCLFFPLNNGTSYNCNTSKHYSTSQTNFTNWGSIVTSYGD